MAEPFLGEVRMFGGNFNPQGWEFCNGQLLQIADYDALYALLGTTYGGDGISTFGLPDLRSRIPFGFGATMPLGQRGGAEEANLTQSHLPPHTHQVAASSGAGTTASPTGQVWSSWADTPYSSAAPTTALSGQAVSVAGGSRPHENRPPFLALSFIIATYGIYPSFG